jgi:CRP/FNR family transcriptional regulator, cyclic AMP receptor protein
MNGKGALPAIEQAFGCSLSLAAVIKDRAEFHHYQPRDKLINNGEAVSHAYLIVDGHAREVALSVDGRVVLVQDFGPGDLFGEATILGDALATEDVVAVEITDAAQFRSQDLIALIENYSCVALAFSRAMTRRLHQTRRRMVEGATLSASGRVHAELLRQGKASGTFIIIPAPVMTEFAMLVQSTRETVSRTVSALEKRGIIRRDAHSLTIVAPHRLEELIY